MKKEKKEEKKCCFRTCIPLVLVRASQFLLMEPVGTDKGYEFALFVVVEIFRLIYFFIANFFKIGTYECKYFFLLFSVVKLLRN